MKNLFDYATSELSQDAFLLWLFDSWEDKEIKPIVHSLLKMFCRLGENDQIKNIKPNAQWKHCDIRLDIQTEKRSIILLIEDKTFSSEHSNQLENYKKALGQKEGNVYFVFYKTSEIGEDEKKRVIAAGWEPYNLNDILKIFCPFKNSSVFLVKQYYEHLNELDKCNKNETKPERSETRKDLQKWIGYFNNVIIKHLKKEIEDAGCFAYSFSNHYGYTFLIVERNRKGERTLPYLEIRSRDCLNGNFRALVLGYGIDEKELKEMVPTLTEKAKQSGWKTKYQRHKQDKEPKQICYFKPDAPTFSDEDFRSHVKHCIEKYSALISNLDCI